MQQTKNHDLITDKHQYNTNSPSNTINSFPVPNFENNNNNKNNKIVIADILLPQQNNTFNATKIFRSQKTTTYPKSGDIFKKMNPASNTIQKINSKNLKSE